MLRRLVIVAGLFSVLLGCVVLFGWYTHNVAVIQVLPAFAPMQYNTALGFLLCGIGLGFILRRALRGMGVFAGSLVMLLGGLTLAEYVFRIDLGIDQLFMEHYITEQTSHPGRMAPNTALCFLLSGLAIILCGTYTNQKKRSILVTLLGALVMALGLIAFAGYVANLETAYGWGHLTRMAVHTSLGFIVVGGGITAFAWLLSQLGKTIFGWLSLYTSIGIAVLSVCFWQALVSQNAKVLEKESEQSAQIAALLLKTDLDTMVSALNRMVKRRNIADHADRIGWERDVANYVSDFSELVGFELVQLVSGDRWFMVGSRRTAEKEWADLVGERVPVSHSADEVALSGVFPLSPDGKGFLISLPVHWEDGTEGYLRCVVDVSTWLKPLFSKLSPGYSRKVKFNGVVVYGDIDDGFAEQRQLLAASSSLDAYQQSIEVALWPIQSLKEKRLGALPTIILLLGLVLSAISGLAVYALQMANLRGKLAEKRAREISGKEEVTRNWLDDSTDGLWDWNMETGAQFMSPKYWELFGYDPKTKKHHISECRKIIHPDDQPLVEEKLKEHIESGGNVPFHQEVRYLHQDGSWVHVISRGKVIEWSDDGHPVRMVGTHTDITALKDVEQALARSNTELEQFAYVASHDLQEPLRTVTSYLQLVEQRYADQLGEDGKEFIAFAVDASKRMKGLIVSLLTLSRVGSRKQPLQVVSSERVLAQVLQDMRPRIEETGAVITHDRLPEVRADETQLGQLFQNLLSNGIKYQSNDRPPEIHVGVESFENKWIFSVRDNGIGIDSKYFDRIFRVFQRLHTKADYSGTGIGLAVCQKIVHLHGGKIWVESESGQGTTFFFTLKDARASDATRSGV